jgi:hypothetical protein
MDQQKDASDMSTIVKSSDCNHKVRLDVILFRSIH